MSEAHVPSKLFPLLPEERQLAENKIMETPLAKRTWVEINQWL